MADEDKLVKAGIEAALKPFTDLLEKLAGPAAEEIGLTLKDHVRVFRLKRQLRLFERVKTMLQDVEVEPKKVAIKLLVPIIENASVEEDDFLQDKWAALLANTARDSTSIHPSFLETLRQLNSMEAILLDVIWERARDREFDNHHPSEQESMVEMSAMRRIANLTKEDINDISTNFRQMVVTNNLMRMGLAAPPNRV